MFDGKFDSGRILYVSREQQDVQSFADGNVQHKVNLTNDALINALTRD